jgi:3-methyladenine DNA glycosylase AlkD
MHPLQKSLRKLANPKQAIDLSRFFKTGPGQYGEGDLFLGIKVPSQREIAKNFRDTPLSELTPIVQSEWHEERLTVFLIALLQYKSAKEAQARQSIIEFILANMHQLNNWDLVDVIVPGTLGDWLCREPQEQWRLNKWIDSENLWQRRIAVLSTFAMIRQQDYRPTLALCELQLNQNQPLHDLMQKANGWMLREIGKRDLAVLIAFLEKWAATMPRTMLRYAIEKLPENQRQDYLKRKN